MSSLPRLAERNIEREWQFNLAAKICQIPDLLKSPCHAGFAPTLGEQNEGASRLFHQSCQLSVTFAGSQVGVPPDFEAGFDNRLAQRLGAGHRDIESRVDEEHLLNSKLGVQIADLFDNLFNGPDPPVLAAKLF